MDSQPSDPNKYIMCFDQALTPLFERDLRCGLGGGAVSMTSSSGGADGRGRFHFLPERRYEISSSSSVLS